MLWVRDKKYWAKIGSFLNQIFTVLILVPLIQVADLHAQPDTLIGVSGSDKVNPVQIQESFGNLPLYFIENQDHISGYHLSSEWQK